MFLPHFDVLCDLWKDRCTATWNLFVLYNKELNFVCIKPALLHVRRAKVGRSLGALHFENPEKKAIWRHLWSIQNEAISLVAVRWQRLVIGLGKSRNCQTWLECRFSWNENLQRRKNWAAKSTILKENARKVKSVFVIRSAQWTEKLGCSLSIVGVEKCTRKTCDYGQPGGHLIRVLNKER